MVRRPIAGAAACALIAFTALGCESDGECKCASDTTDTADTAQADTGPTAVLPDATALPGPAIRFSFARTQGLFDAPVPALDLFDDQGHPRLSAWPRERDSFVDRLALLAEETDGASLAGATYFAFDAPLPEATAQALDAALSGLFIDADAASAERGRVREGLIAYEPDGGPYGAPDMLALLPVQGVPLRPKTRYLAVLVSQEPVSASPFGRGAALADLLAGREVAGLGPYRADIVDALGDAVDRAALDPTHIVGLTVFRTGDPVSELGEFLAAARAEPPPDLTGFSLVETHERFCVYGKTLTMPDYQHGDLPFANPGDGTWQRDPQGRPLIARQADSRVFVTVPRTPAPEAGLPTVVFIRTGGGGDRPLIDRGPRAEAHGDPIVPTGTGPAMNLAAAGWAGITWDGPHGGPRNPTGGDEQFLMFNVLNPAGTRDSVRQTALEAILVADLAGRLTIDTRDCDGASPETRFDPDELAIMGHSMGAWIAPIAMAHSAQFKRAILSGAGGSWIANVIYKKSPLDVRPLAEQILGYTHIGRALDVFDPALTLLQWAGERADPQSYGQLAMTPARDVLMIEGIVDTYIMPPIANTTALSFGLDLASEAYDAEDPRLSEFTPLVDLLPLVSGHQLPTPVSGNRQGRTAVVVQAPGDEIEDGHEAMFQTPGPKHQYRCFLETALRAPAPTVVAPLDEWAPCP